MQTTTVANQTPTNEAPRKQKASSPDAFALTLLNTQAATALTNVGIATDASGLNPGGESASKSARRERVNQETSEARTAEAKQSRSATMQADQRSSGVDARRAAGESVTSNSNEAAISESAKAKNTTASEDSTQARLAQSTVDSRAASGQSTARQDVSLVDEASRVATKQKNTPAPQTPPSIDDGGSNKQVVQVTTAGAARASAERSATASSPAQSIGKLLSARGESARVEQPIAATTQPGKEHTAQAKTAADTDQTSRQGESKDTKGAGGSSETRRGEFLQLIRNLRLANNRGESSATLRLDPPDLGKMRVQVRMQQDTLQLRIEVESDSARALIQSRSSELTAALREHDIHVERFEILSVSTSEGDQASDFAESQNKDSNEADTRNASTRGATEQSTGSVEDIDDSENAAEHLARDASTDKALDMNA